MDLVTDHMLQALIVSWVEEDHDLEALTSEPIVHDLVAVSLVAQIVQLLRDVIDSLALEWSGIAFIAVQTSHLRQDGLNQVTDCHARRDSVRVNDHVWHDTFNCERQVFLPIGHTARTFLTVTTGELVTDLRDLDGTHLDLNQAAHFLVRGHHHLVDVAFLAVLQRRRPVLLWLCVQLLLLQIVQLCVRDRRHFANDDIVTTDLGSRTNNTILVKLVVGAMLATRRLDRIRNAEFFVPL